MWETLSHQRTDRIFSGDSLCNPAAKMRQCEHENRYPDRRAAHSCDRVGVNIPRILLFLRRDSSSGRALRNSQLGQQKEIR